MSNTTARLSEVIVTLNQCINQLSDNDTIEFDVEDRISNIEAQVDTLSNEIEESLEFSRETSS